MFLSKLIGEMMSYYGNVRLSEHAVKAYAYAASIGEGESLCEDDMLILSAAAILHDIGIPRAKELYGSAKGEYQEKEGTLLVPDILSRAGMPDFITEQVAWLVGHHHTEELAKDNFLLQILIEADYLVNFAEGNRPSEALQQVYRDFFKTNTGKQYMKGLFSLQS
ncbi:MAG: HD domain-containing protein [Defluviitaleaceae bacterium]|nr:HD domain-containing protein [Defluviitaleaceae bacterium]